MPITKRAIKKLAHDRKRTSQNLTVEANLKKLVKSMRKSPSKKKLATVFGALDKAANKNIIHKNKASRLKSRLSLMIAKK